MQLTDLNALSSGAATATLLACCGSTRWARIVAELRPFAAVDALAGAADRVWASLGPADWLEAFAAHPRIGDSAPTGEQAGMRSASSGVRERLAQANREYEARFGYMFIVCATGKSADQMLAILERRLANTAADELKIAADEQQKITQLRLEKLLA